jgi:type I restriction enzyme S subunit
MASEWRQRKIGDIIACNTDTYSPKEKWPFVNYLDTGNITKGTIDSFQLITDHDALPTRARRKVQPGDIVYSTVRPNQNHYGIIKQPLPNMLVSTGFAVIRGVQGECDTRFLYYYLTQLTIIDYLHSVGENSTSAYPSVRPTDIESLDICLPPLSIQMRIADILGKLDDKIELNRRMNRTLEKMAAAIFKSWFIDFDPVHAKAEGRDPNLPAEISNLFPERIEESELGAIPTGWRRGSLVDVADSPRRGVNPSDVPMTTPYIGLEHMPRRCIALDVWGLAEDVASAKSQFRQGEILFGKLRPYFHKVGIAPVDGVCSTDIVVVTPKFKDWHGYVISLVSSKAFVDYTDSHSAGTKMPRTNWKDMGHYPLALPPVALAKAFQGHVASIHQRIVLNVRQNRRLAGLRDTLLPKLLSGETELPAAESIVESVQ